MLYLLGLERKQKILRSHILFRSYSFGIEMINTFIHFRSSLKNHTRFQTKWAKCIRGFRPKRRKNPTDRVVHNYMAYIRESPPGLISTFNVCFGRFWSVWTHAYYLVLTHLAFRLSY